MNFNIVLSRRLFDRLIKRSFVIVVLISMLVAGASAYAAMLLNKPVYTYSGELVQNDNNTALLSSYQQFVESKGFTEMINTEVKNSKWKNISRRDAYTVTIKTNEASNSTGNAVSPFFQLNVSSTNEAYAAYIVKIAMNQLMGKMGKYFTNSNISIVSDTLKEKQSDFKSTILRYGIYGFFVSFILIEVCLILKRLFIGKVKDSDFIEDVFGYSNFGSINISQVEKR